MAQCSLYSADTLIINDQIENNRSVETPEIEKKQDNVSVDPEIKMKPIEHTKEKIRNREEKNKRKDEKRPAEQVLKGLNDVRAMEDKLEVISKKYSEATDENRRLQVQLNQHDKKMICLQGEKEQLQRERNKGVLARTKLEILSRELQKQNKAVKEESLLKVRKQEEIRRTLAELFPNCMTEISGIMDVIREKYEKMRDVHLPTMKLGKDLCDQCKMQQQEVVQMHIEIKSKLKMAEMDVMSATLESNAEKAALLKERQNIFNKLTEDQVQILELEATEIDLRSQISMYTDKYEEFQNALTRSDKADGEFNEEMERMSKKILMLEKETTLWKQRYESSHAALFEMIADKQIRESEMAKLKEKIRELHSTVLFCRFARTDLQELIASKTLAQNETQESALLTMGVDELSKQCLEIDVKVREFDELHSSYSKILESIETNMKEELSQKEVLEQRRNTNATHKKRGKPERKLKNKELKQIKYKTTNKSQEEYKKCSLIAEKISNELNLVAEDTKLIESAQTTKEQPEESSHDKKVEFVESTQDKEKKLVESSQEKTKHHVESLQEKTKYIVESLPEKTKDCVESLQEETKDPVESLQDETGLEELPIKETENMNARLIQENQDSNIGDSCENIFRELYKVIDSLKQETVADDGEMLNNTNERRVKKRGEGQKREQRRKK